MKVQLGNNAKLGKRIATISREVGPTCPQSCPFLNNGCYAERLQAFRSTVKKAWKLGNKPTNLQKVIDQLLDWKAKGKCIALRLHVGGDFLWKGEIDRHYLASILYMLRKVQLPAFVYTHAVEELAPHVRSLLRAGCQVFASVHPPVSWADSARLRSVGYRIAYQSPSLKSNMQGEKRAMRACEGVWIPCPEQVGTKKTCEDCGYCFRQNPNGVIFFKH